MAYIKHADITTQEIMDSHLGGAVLGYEIGKICNDPLIDTVGEFNL